LCVDVGERQRLAWCAHVHMHVPMSFAA
jgi:hypothetical protein